MQEHKGKMKRCPVQVISVSRHFSMKPPAALLYTLGLKVFSAKVTQAFLQSSEKLQKIVFIRLSSELGLKFKRVLKPVEPLFKLLENYNHLIRTFEC